MTLDRLALRHSVRSYCDEPLSEEETAAIRAAVTAINTHEAGLHFKLIKDSPEAFSGFGRSYGMFRGVRNYVALAVDSKSYPYIEEKAGYYAQMLVMRCVGMGLGTCFVGGTFSSRHVDMPLRAGWEIIAVVALGHPAEDRRDTFIARMARRVAKRRSKAPAEFYKGDIDLETAMRTFPLLLPALKAVALAPSALNRQPVEIRVSKSGCSDEEVFTDRYEREIMAVEAENRRFLLSPIVSVMQPSLMFDSGYAIEAGVVNKSQLIDLGIAMWNFEQLFPGYWQWGNPARFIPLDAE